MTKTKKTIMWATIACLLVVGVAGATVGVTYARYSSSGEGTGSANIAYWNVTVGTDEITAEAGTASPSAEAYSSTARTNTSAAQPVAKIVNNGNVDADVTATLKEGSLTFNWRHTLQDTDSDYVALDTTTFEDYETIVADATNHFSIVLCDETEQAFEGTTVAASSDYTLYAEVTWTTDTDTMMSDGGYDGTAGDHYDTFYGTYLMSISFTIDITATQASAN